MARASPVTRPWRTESISQPLVAHITSTWLSQVGSAAGAGDLVRDAGWGAHEVPRAERMAIRGIGAEPQRALALEHEEHLLGLVVDVEGRGFTRLEDHEEGLAGGAIGAIHDEVVGVCREAVPDGIVRMEHVLRHRA
jgi:hypothetical protein